MLTLHDVVQVAEAQRRFPNWILWLLGTAFAVWAIGSMADAFPWQGSGNVSRPTQQVEQPVAQPTQQAPVVVAPIVKEWPTFEVRWVKIGEGRNPANHPIPTDKFSFVPGPVVRAELNFPDGFHGYGDGTAFLVKDGEGEFFFTRDRGASWFKVANPYPGKSITPPNVAGASLEGNTLVLFIVLQQEPWFFTSWRAEIPLNELEGLTR